MTRNRVHNVKYLTKRRRALRHQLTPAEIRLWNVLKGKGLDDRKFRRQHSIENYIVDFFCPVEKLVIELDGEIHNNILNRQLDFERDRRLGELGYRVLRFENGLIFSELNNVLRIIEGNFKYKEDF